MVVRTLLEACPALAQKFHVVGFPLHHACFQSFMNPDVLLLLVQAWPEAVRVKRFCGRFPIHLYCQFHWSHLDEKVLREMITHWPESLRVGPEIPLDIVCKSMREEINPAILEVLSEGYPMHFASQQSNQLGTLKQLHRINSLYIESRDKEGKIPLHHLGQNDKMTRWMKNAFYPGVSFQDSLGNLPIHYAAARGYLPCSYPREGQLDIISMMLRCYPKSVRVRNNQGLLPWQVAALQGDLDCVYLCMRKYPESLLSLNLVDPEEE